MISLQDWVDNIFLNDEARNKQYWTKVNKMSPQITTDINLKYKAKSHFRPRRLKPFEPFQKTAR